MHKRNDYPKLRRGDQKKKRSVVSVLLLDIFLPVFVVALTGFLGFTLGQAKARASCDCSDAPRTEVRIVRSATDRELLQCREERRALLRKLNHQGISYYKGRFYTDTLWPTNVD